MSENMIALTVDKSFLRKFLKGRLMSFTERGQNAKLFDSVWYSRFWSINDSVPVPVYLLLINISSYFLKFSHWQVNKKTICWWHPTSLSQCQISSCHFSPLNFFSSVNYCLFLLIRSHIRSNDVFVVELSLPFLSPSCALYLCAMYNWLFQLIII